MLCDYWDETEMEPFISCDKADKNVYDLYYPAKCLNIPEGINDNMKHILNNYSYLKAFILRYTDPVYKNQNGYSLFFCIHIPSLSPVTLSAMIQLTDDTAFRVFLGPAKRAGSAIKRDYARLAGFFLREIVTLYLPDWEIDWTHVDYSLNERFSSRSYCDAVFQSEIFIFHY